MGALQIVPGVAATDTNMTTNLTETEYAQWSAGTSYAALQYCIYKHVIYQRVTAGSGSTTPDVDAASTAPVWLAYRATNAWAMFDKVNSTQSISSSAIVTTLTPGQAVDLVFVSNLTNVASVRVVMTDPAAGTVFDQTVSCVIPQQSADFWSYCFNPISYRTQLIFSGLPSYQNCSVTVTITPVSGATCGVGTLLIGQSRSYGNGANYGARVGIVDYSVKTKNAFGDYTVVVRNFARRATFDVAINNTELDSLNNLLASLRAVPVLYIGYADYEAMAILGFYKSYEILISYPTMSVVSFDLEGTT